MWAKRCKAASLAPSLSIPITVIGQCTGQVLLRPRTTLEAGPGGRPDRRAAALAIAPLHWSENFVCHQLTQLYKYYDTIS